MFLVEQVKFLLPRFLAKRDAVKDWETIVSLMNITDKNEGNWTDEQKKQKIRYNSLYVIWFLFCAMRIGPSGMLVSKSYYHIIGFTLANSGNVRNLMGTAAGIALVMCAVYRIKNIKLIHKNQMSFMRKVREMRKQRRMAELREEPVKDIEHDVLLITSTAIRMTILSAMAIVTGMMGINVWKSESLSEIAGWIFWWTGDLMLCFTADTDIFFFPAIWILTCFFYTRRLDYFQRKVEKLANPFDGISQQSNHFRAMLRTYINLLNVAVGVNHMLSNIMFPLATFTTPLCTVCLFVSLYSDNILFNIAVPVIAVLLTLPAVALQAMAARVSSKSDEMHKLIMHLLTSQLPVPLLLHQQKILLKVMDEIGGQESPLALYSIDGLKYTSHSFVEYLISLGLNYLLILTFDKLFTLH